jgi:hypothetical protein
MARNRPTPEPLATVQPSYVKTSGYSPDVSTMNRRRSPGPPEHSWGSGSYDKSGRGTKTTGSAPGYGGASNPGRHTLGEK